MPFWTTQDLPSDKQFGFWREVLCEAFITLNPSRKSRGTFSGSVEANMLSDVNVTRLLTEEHRVIRGAREIRKTPLEYYFVNMQVKGDVLAKQRGREVLQSAGAVAVIPRAPLDKGTTYTVSMTVNGQEYKWSFSIAP